MIAVQLIYNHYLLLFSVLFRYGWLNIFFIFIYACIYLVFKSQFARFMINKCISKVFNQ